MLTQTIWHILLGLLLVVPFSQSLAQGTILDTYYSLQWNLENTGQSGGVAGADINIRPVWGITTGSEDIIVAIVDNFGVSFTHEDISTGQVISGYTVDGGIGTQFDESKIHNQLVLGIIGMNHNGLGGRGISPNSKVMPISFNNNGDRVKIAAAIDFAVDNGADIINNSWVLPGTETNTDIETALTRASELGVLVVNATGNSSYGNFVQFPATMPSGLSVGGINNLDQAYVNTPHSNETDIVAPSGELGVGKLEMFSTNFMSAINAPFNSHYNNLVSGTSFASPHIAGIASLILSINPNIEARSAGVNQNPELQNILKNTASSYGTTDWAGAGRVDAYAAIIYTIENYGAFLGKDAVKDVVVPFEGTIAFQQDVELASDATLTLTSKSGNLVTLKAGSGSVRIGEEYVAPLAKIVKDSQADINEDSGSKSKKFALLDNYPNPFNPTTQVAFELPVESEVILEVYNLMGQKVATLANGQYDAGLHTVQLNAGNFSSGVYIYKIKAGNFVQTKRMTLIK